MKVRRATILVDVDEVLFPFAHSYDEWLVRERGIGLDPDLMNRYEIADAAGEGHRGYAVRFLNDPATLEIEPVAGALASVQTLGSTYRLVACTTRRNEPEGAATQAWLDRHLPGFDELVCTSERHDSAAIAKSDVAIKHRAVALIDDTEGNLAGLPDYCRPLLLRRPPGLHSDQSALTWGAAVASLHG